MTKRGTLLLVLLYFPLLIFSQRVDRVRFEQVGDKIYINYNLKGNSIYHVEVYCSTDNGDTWGLPLTKVTGDVGDNITPGNGKKIIWDAGEERNVLKGKVRFKIILFKNKTFIDPRDNQSYKTVDIGTQTWFAQNLNYNVGNSWCYNHEYKYCESCGRLYDWNTALIACPEGWHLPSEAEWTRLENYIRDHTINISRNNPDGKSNNVPLFPGSLCMKPDLSNAFNNWFSNWWTSTEYSYTFAWYRSWYNNKQLRRLKYIKAHGFSVRCVKD
jgi:uncharacterized protein (TIGR02145 family)